MTGVQTCALPIFTIGPQNSELNDYWTLDEKILKPKEKIFSSLKTSKVETFAFIMSEWQKAEDCPKCFPPEQELTSEQALFGVNRGSVVPMLRLGVNELLKPLDMNIIDKEHQNLRILFDLSKFMYYSHIIRNENHYQFYFDTVGFFNYIMNTPELKKNLDDKLSYFRSLLKETDEKSILFDYIVAPRHTSNSAWIHYIKEEVFGGTNVRIIYFDVDKEYRSNIKAKYSDFLCSIENIKSGFNSYKIRFHFVDDSIYSGASFLRAKNIISSLIGYGDNCIELFSSIILLISRISLETQKFYLETPNKFFNFVNFSISPMRKFEDACTLCKLLSDLEDVKKQCSTNILSKKCFDVIEKHKANDFSKLKEYCSEEKRLLFLITHILTKRMSNELIFLFEKNIRPVNCTSENAKSVILDILNNYYDLGKKIIGGIIEETKYKIAFIKTLSRPFFIYSIRYRQAAFSFCINQLANYITNSQELQNITEQDLKIITALIKGLTDLDANYLIRASVIVKLLNYAKLGDSLKKKNVISTEGLLFYIKKLLVLSRDTKKSVLLERILILGSETEGKKDSQNLFFVTNSFFKKLYFENNRILSSFLNKNNLSNNIKILGENLSETYYLANFKSIYELNTNINLESKVDRLKSIKVFEEYQSLRNLLSEIYKNPSDIVKLDIKINNFFNSFEFKKSMSAVTFVRDTESDNELFEFFLLSVEDISKNLEICQFFYHNSNIQIVKDVWKKLDNKGRQQDHSTNQEELDFYEIDNNFGKYIFIKFCGEDFDNEKDRIYVQIRNFDSHDLLSWFKIKMFLTLREDFSKLIHKLNISGLAKSRSMGMQRRALAIGKATTHNNASRYSSLSIANYNHTYYQLLSNEFISSLYRKIVRKERARSNPIKFSIIKDQLEELFQCLMNDKNFKLTDSNKFAEIIIINRVGKTEKIKLSFILNDITDNDYILSWGLNGNICTIVYLIILMAMNVFEHGEKSNESNENKYMMNISFNTDDTIEFESKIKNGTTKNDINEKLDIPPWFFEREEDQHITLWSFKHSQICRNFDISGKDIEANEDFISLKESQNFNFNIDEDKRLIKFSFKLIKRGYS